MERKPFTLWHITVWCLLFGLAFQVVQGEDEITGITDGACYIDSLIKDGLVCTADITTDPLNKFYVAEQTYCAHRTRDLCLTCIDGTMVKMTCYEAPRKRPKRGFFRSVGRAISSVGRVITGSHSSGSPPNTQPSITCPNVPSPVHPGVNSNLAYVRWNNPTTSDKENNIRSTVLTTGKGPGSGFTEGTHTVSYKVTDAGGLSNTCSFSFTVKVIRCPAPPAISNGKVQCASTIGTVLGTKCTYSCNTGYEVSGFPYIFCQSSGKYTTIPTCRKIFCSNLPRPKHLFSVKCSDGFKYQSVCSPICEKGYLPGRGARLYCPASGKWQQTSWTCGDEVAPVFNDCPTKTLTTTDRRFKFVPTAKDSAGKVTVTQIQGKPAGTLLDFGSHLMKYVATDPSGNKAYCDFALDVQATDCPVPTSNDKDITFTCNGRKVSSVCLISCASKARVEGSKYISCVPDKTENNLSQWEPSKGGTASCHKASCPPLKPPKNGALACDKQLGGSSCQIQCNKDFDVALSERRFNSFICTDEGEWQPRGTVPDCLEFSFPDGYYLPTEFYYYTGACSDDKTLNDIKQLFIDTHNSIGLSPCMTDVCSVDDIKVTCGDLVDPIGFDFRRKRSTKPTGLHISVKVHVKNSERKLSPVAAKTLILSVVENYKKAITNSSTIRTDVHLGSADAPLPAKIISVTGNLSMDCGAGDTQVQPGKCVPCSIGSYADKGTCTTCPQNTYQNKSGSISCEPCPAHHTTLSTGAVSRDECIELCKINEYSPTGRVPCLPCGEGKHQPHFGSTKCLP